MTSDSQAGVVEGLQDRHSVAEWLGTRSLRVRLLVFVGAIVAAVVTAVAFLEVRSFERTIDLEISDAARLTARAVADDLMLVQGPLDPNDVRDTLHEFAEANPVVRSISVVKLNLAQAPELVASTSSEERDEILALARRAIVGRGQTMERTDDQVSFAVPVQAGASALAAVATVSLAPLHAASERGRTIALGFALPIIVLVTLLVDLTTRALVHRPVALIRQTMLRAAEGDLRSRAPIVRRDELGAVASGLNEMLVRLEDFNVALQTRVREATEELRERNAELGESYHQMLILREALARADRMGVLGQMAANVAHQAGTPLNLISGYVQMIREDPAADARVKQRLDIVNTQIQQVTSVLRTMLDQAREPLQREETGLADLVERVCDLAAPRLAQSGVRVERSVPRALPRIEVDVVQFELVLLALITNALDAMSHGGTLTIRASVEGAMIHLEVADTGGGIPPDLLDRIFEPWTTTKPAGRGSGLGLGIARDVIRMHGGAISARNAVGGGATIAIDLPYVAAGGDT